MRDDDRATEAPGLKCPFGFSGPADADKNDRPVRPAMSRSSLPQFSPTPIDAHDSRMTGRCLCGAISFRIDRPVDKVFAHHDPAFRRWSGGLALTILVRATSMSFHNWGRIASFASSERECRCFCRTCGTHMFVRHVQPPAMEGMLSLCAGTLDHGRGLRLAAETHVDRRPDYLNLGGNHRRMTEAEIEAMYAPSA